jgi:hypothetical protein
MTLNPKGNSSNALLNRQSSRRVYVTDKLDKMVLPAETKGVIDTGTKDPIYTSDANHFISPSFSDRNGNCNGNRSGGGSKS